VGGVGLGLAYSYGTGKDALESIGMFVGFLNTLRAVSNSCFTGETKIMARGWWGCGWRRIDEIIPGDEVLSRDENNPYGPLMWKLVELRFVRTARIVHLHVGGKVIRTTAEHPLWVYGKGWVTAIELRAGDRLNSHDGQGVAVEQMYDTGQYETVYNVSVADFHTYFVGSDLWGFSVWAHNAVAAIYRGDAFPGKRTDPKGDPKAHFRKGALYPANPEGIYIDSKGVRREVTVVGHVLGKYRLNARRNTPYTSWTEDRDTAVSYGKGKSGVGYLYRLKLRELRQAIQDGKVSGVSILSTKQVLAAINRSKEAPNFKTMARNFAIRDREVLVRGIIPAEFITRQRIS
jgi:hypothetical protein